MAVLFLALAMGSATPAAVPPAWWGMRNVLNAGASADDYAAANIGQLKTLARKAAAEMDAVLPGGAGQAVQDLVSAWQQGAATGTVRDDFTALNAGQAKSVVKPFYDRLATLGFRPAGSYPWSGSPGPVDDYALVNVGQLKTLFAFEIPHDISAPTGFALISGEQTSSSLNFRWFDNSDLEEKYILESSPIVSPRIWSAVKEIAPGDVSGGLMQEEVTGLAEGTQYAFRVSAVRGLLKSYSSELAATTLLKQPAAPSWSPVIGSSSIRLSWQDMSSQETSYNVFRTPIGVVLDGFNSIRLTQHNELGSNTNLYEDIAADPYIPYSYYITPWKGSQGPAGNVLALRPSGSPSNNDLFLRASARIDVPAIPNRMNVNLTRDGSALRLNMSYNEQIGYNPSNVLVERLDFFGDPSPTAIADEPYPLSAAITDTLPDASQTYLYRVTTRNMRGSNNNPVLIWTTPAGMQHQPFAVNVTTSGTSPHIQLGWGETWDHYQFAISRKEAGETVWVAQSLSPGMTRNSWSDIHASPGKVYDYKVSISFGGDHSSHGGVFYLRTGYNPPLVEDRGKVLLIIDQTIEASIQNELDALKTDLVGDGWQVVTSSVNRMAVSRGAGVSAGPARRAELDQVKSAVLQNHTLASPLRSVILIGRVPVPYAGTLARDGHNSDGVGHHEGAWPADAYYADADSSAWTDATAYVVTSPDYMQNVPGDGKFDADLIPTKLEFEVGRVDMNSMSTMESLDEAGLIRQYFRRDTQYRHKQGGYSAVDDKILMGDYFAANQQNSAYTTGAKSTARAWYGDNASANTTYYQSPSTWFTYAENNSFIFGCGCGAGTLYSADGVGTSSDFANMRSRVVFTALFGSWFGDWDLGANNFLRAPLTGPPESLGLCSFWASSLGGGDRSIDLSQMSFGASLGESIKECMNGYRTGSFLGTHPGLMGDPTLRLHVVSPVNHLTVENQGGVHHLEWSSPSSPEAHLYHVYHGESEFGPFTRLTSSNLQPDAANPMAGPITQTFFDAPVTNTNGPHYYMVKCVNMQDNAAGGSYTNNSVGITIKVPLPDTPRNPTNLTISKVIDGRVLAWTDQSDDETGYQVERRCEGELTWTVVASSLPADTTTWTDSSQSDDTYPYYRVSAFNASGISAASLPSHEQ